MPVLARRLAQVPPADPLRERKDPPRLREDLDGASAFFETPDESEAAPYDKFAT